MFLRDTLQCHKIILSPPFCETYCCWNEKWDELRLTKTHVRWLRSYFSYYMGVVHKWRQAIWASSTFLYYISVWTVDTKSFTSYSPNIVRSFTAGPQVSISPTVYEQLFCTKVMCSTFLFGFIPLYQENWPKNCS